MEIKSFTFQLYALIQFIIFSTTHANELDLALAAQLKDDVAVAAQLDKMDLNVNDVVEIYRLAMQDTEMEMQDDDDTEKEPKYQGDQQVEVDLNKLPANMIVEATERVKEALSELSNTEATEAKKEEAKKLIKEKLSTMITMAVNMGRTINLITNLDKNKGPGFLVLKNKGLGKGKSVDAIRHNRIRRADSQEILLEQITGQTEIMIAQRNQLENVTKQLETQKNLDEKTQTREEEQQREEKLEGVGDAKSNSGVLHRISKKSRKRKSRKMRMDATLKNLEEEKNQLEEEKTQKTQEAENLKKQLEDEKRTLDETRQLQQLQQDATLKNLEDAENLKKQLEDEKRTVDETRKMLDETLETLAQLEPQAQKLKEENTVLQKHCLSGIKSNSENISTKLSHEQHEQLENGKTTDSFAKKIAALGKCYEAIANAAEGDTDEGDVSDAAAAAAAGAVAKLDQLT